MSTRTTEVAAGADENAAAGEAFLGLREQVLMLRAGHTTSRKLVEAALERAEKAQPKLNAFRVLCSEEALAAADEADRHLAGGDGASLLGVPVAIKDDVDLAGHTTPSAVAAVGRRCTMPRPYGVCARRARS